MDSTTQMQVNDIIKRGWYQKSQTLGRGGWSAVKELQGSDEWKYYTLYEMGEHVPFTEVETICAKNDETALKAFSSLYHMDRFEMWDIYEKITEYRLVDTSDKGE